MRMNRDQGRARAQARALREQLRGTVRTLALLGLGLGLSVSPAIAQAIAFTSELPRTLVFIQEEGGAGIATSDVVGFLRDANFPLVDPALAHTAAQRELVQAALRGDEGAAVQLGRDFGAQMLILGSAQWGTTVDPVSGKLQTGTSDVSVRALRLDAGKVIAAKNWQGRKLDVTEQAARTGAIREAISGLLGRTEFVGAMVNSWDEEPWSARGYFRPDPGSLGAVMGAPGGAGAPKLAILRTDVLPPVGNMATRGIGVVKRGTGAASVTNEVVIEGVVIGNVASVNVDGTAAKLAPMDAAEARKVGAEGAATKFTAKIALPLNRDTVQVVAQSPSGETAVATASPRIDKRWAVVIGIGQYQASDITDLRYAGADAQAFYDFLRSPAAGPFPEENILFLKDGAATAQALREAMFVFLQKADWDDLVVIYFAGHGAPDPNRPENLYLLPTDADLKQLAATAFPMWDVKTALRRQISSERVIVIADACHSAGTSEGAEKNPINASFADLFTPSRRLTLTAADANELSYEDPKWGGGHGVFTFNLIEGLRGAADADANGIVTFAEVSDFVSGRVAKETNGRQNPQRSGLGDVPLAVVEASASGQSSGGN